MDEAVINIVEFVRTDLKVQAILATALVVLFFAIWREVVAIRRNRRKNRAIFASPMLSAREVFPDGYLQRARGICYSSRGVSETGSVYSSNR
jgi:hypothetical protein